ncbi:hypothetical protein POUND7_008279 [Theobroma cacao]
MKPSFNNFLGSATPVVTENETDKRALLEFKAKIIDDHFGVMHLWNNTIPFCQWHGVTCGHRHQRITKLDLRSIKIQGSLPLDLGITMSCIETLAVADNQFTGPIPVSISNASNLVEFNVVENKLSGSLPSFEKLDKLSRFVIGVNLLGIKNLKNLRGLSVSQNRLSGVLPNNFGSCVRLERLFLYGNLFQGPIPSSLSSLRGLIELDISSNNLLGQIPKFLVNFGSLQYLNLSFNDFEGMVPIE